MTEVTAVFATATALFALGAGIIAAFGRATMSSELWRHYGATALMVAAVLVPAALHPALFAILAALAAWRVAVELAAIHGLRFSPILHAGVAACMLAAAWLGREPGLVVALSVPVLLIAAPIYASAMRHPLRGAARWIFTLAFPLMAAAHLSRLVHAEQGFLWICFLYAIVETQDSMAFLFGRLFGRRPLAPRLSPRKTVEGALAGALWGTAVGTLIGALLMAQPWPVAAALALLVAVSGFCGDLFASGLKRGAGVKDFPALHPRHGGLLDIYDSTMFSAIVLSPALWLLGMP